MINRAIEQSGSTNKTFYERKNSAGNPRGSVMDSGCVAEPAALARGLVRFGLGYGAVVGAVMGSGVLSASQDFAHDAEERVEAGGEPILATEKKQFPF